MKGKIIIINKNNTIYFYWIDKKLGKMYLFSQRFSKGVYDFFCRGRSITEIFGYKNWNYNPRLDKTITKLPMYVKYALKEYDESYPSYVQV